MKNFCLVALSLIMSGNLHGQRYAVIISEFMADPSPPMGLPEYEWVELYNRSDREVNLSGWRIADANSQSGPLPSFVLQPGAYVLIAGSTAASHLSAFSNCIAVSSWPSLDNTGDIIALYNNDMQAVHAVSYDENWYGNALKKAGGWSLEIKDVEQPCMGRDNWHASIDALGGSPGRTNSISELIQDHTSLQFTRVYPMDTRSIILQFNKSLDSASAVRPLNYSILNGTAIESVEELPPLFDAIKLKLNTDMQENTVYHLLCKNLRDCAGNLIVSDTLPVGLPTEAGNNDCTINEILFNPPPGGVDYVEIYNRSARLLDASSFRLASRNSSGQLQSIIPLAGSPDLFFPGEYRVYCTDTAWLSRTYNILQRENLRQLSSFPSYPDAQGTVVLLNNQGEVLDELNYKESWHFALLPTREAIALERLHPDATTQSASSWHSAAASAGYGTPGYQNSQHHNITFSETSFDIQPRRFSPDNDGFEDQLFIHYNMLTPGNVATILVFDAMGRPVCNIVRNALLGIHGIFTWDGLDDYKRPLSPGIYVVWIEWFDLAGKRKLYKKGVVLGRK